LKKHKDKKVEVDERRKALQVTIDQRKEKVRQFELVRQGLYSL